MPLRDHFHSPVDDFTSWESFHSGWPMVIVQQIADDLPARYVAWPSIPCDEPMEIDLSEVSTRPKWTPPSPTQLEPTELTSIEEYGVRIFDTKHNRRLVAAIEIVSPANKDRPRHRQLFVGKCAALLRQHVSVTIVDLVTERSANLYAELLGVEDESLGDDPVLLYSVACRWRTTDEDKRILEAWNEPMALGQRLPVLPLWLSDRLAIRLDLEESYEKTCRDLRIP